MIDKAPIQLSCPRCDFQNRATIRQVRLRDVIICRGCKSNIQLEDQMNTVRIAERRIRQSLDEFTEAIKSLNMTLTIKL